MNKLWTVFARMALAGLHKYIDGLTDEDLQAAVDKINARLGGKKKIEAKSLKIIVEAVRAALDVIQF